MTPAGHATHGAGMIAAQQVAHTQPSLGAANGFAHTAHGGANIAFSTISAALSPSRSACVFPTVTYG